MQDLALFVFYMFRQAMFECLRNLQETIGKVTYCQSVFIDFLVKMYMLLLQIIVFLVMYLFEKHYAFINACICTCISYITSSNML